MVGGVSDMQWIAAAFGPGVLRPSSPMRGTQETVGPAHLPEHTHGQSQDEDTVEISTSGRQAAEKAGLINPLQAANSSARPKPNDKTDQQKPSAPQSASDTNPAVETASAEKNTQGQELTEEEQAEIDKLKQRDQEVRQHEQAHLSSGGGITKGGASYEFQTGPDGKRYAVGGEVQIDTSAVEGNPEATIRKMQQIQRAAMAPAEPSSQDRQVASQARAAQAKAQAELRQQRQEENGSPTDSTNEVGPSQGSQSPDKPEAASSPSGAKEAENEQNEPQGVQGIMEETMKSMNKQGQQDAKQSPFEAGIQLNQANSSAISAYQNATSRYGMSIRSTLNMVA